MPQRRVRFIILAEDRQQEVFARRFLKRKGYDVRQIDFKTAPKGEGAGEQYVRAEYPREARACRQRASENVALLIMIDEDTESTQNRIQQLDISLREDGQTARRNDEKIAIFTPKRNIETWIHYLQGETVNETGSYQKLDRESDCEPCIDKLLLYAQSDLPGDMPESLRAAYDEWQRIRLLLR